MEDPQLLLPLILLAGAAAQARRAALAARGQEQAGMALLIPALLTLAAVVAGKIQTQARQAVQAAAAQARVKVEAPRLLQQAHLILAVAAEAEVRALQQRDKVAPAS